MSKKQLEHFIVHESDGSTRNISLRGRDAWALSKIFTVYHQTKEGALCVLSIAQAIDLHLELTSSDGGGYAA